MSTKGIVIGSISATLGVLIIAGGIFGWRYYDDSVNYVSTDNAQVAGNIIQISPMSSGRLTALGVQVGDTVRAGETLATVDVPATSTLGLASGAGPVQGTAITSPLSSPVNGVVVGKRAVVGNMVSAGQPVLLVVDLGKLWVTANVDENSIEEVAVGQPVDVHVDMLNQDFTGSVIRITPATAASFSSAPPTNTTSDYTKVTELVPVKIALNYAGSMIFPGASAEVTIKVH